MKALSVRQPWAWAIIYAGKDIENRSRCTRHRGPVAIHATRCTRDDHERDAETIAKISGLKVPAWEKMRETFGTVIGMADLWDSRNDGPAPKSHWAGDEAWWFLREARPSRVYTCKGARGYLFDIPDNAIR